ncbi:MAG: SDR family oxidoreductase [Acidobacteria bacterium]|nr:MAG: SDR family oxidoreductase [Acidobacteriota bacterium]
MRFDDRAVLVTGASGGIGRAICRRFAEGGARLGIHYGRNRQAAEELMASLPGDGHRLLGADLRDAAAVRAMVERTAAELGRLDVLVNNAGIYQLHPPYEVSYDDWQAHWQRTLAVNLVGAANACYCAAHLMRRQGGGRIVNVSSRGAFRGEPDAVAYAASKAGLNALSQSLAQALGPHGIYVFAVAPGFVETAMARPYLDGEAAQAIARQSPLGRVATADDVAYWVSCLAADGGEYATGTIINVNGASYLR